MPLPGAVDPRIVKSGPAPRGRPRHEPTDVTKFQVKQFAAMGLTKPQIATLMCLGVHSLYKYYRQELETGELEANFNVAKTLYTMATDPNHKHGASAAMFWMKTRAKWSEVSKLEVTGKDGGAIATIGHNPNAVDSSQLTYEQRQQLRQLMISALTKDAQSERPPIEHVKEDGDTRHEDDETEDGDDETNDGDDETEDGDDETIDGEDETTDEDE